MKHSFVRHVTDLFMKYSISPALLVAVMALRENMPNRINAFFNSGSSTDVASKTLFSRIGSSTRRMPYADLFANLFGKFGSSGFKSGNCHLSSSLQKRSCCG